MRARWFGVWLGLACAACGSSKKDDEHLFDEAAGATGDSGGSSGAVASSSGNGSTADGSQATSTSDSTSGSGPNSSSTGANPQSAPGPRRQHREVPGGAFQMGRSADGADACPDDMDCLAAELPEHGAIVASFALDTTEVTVAEFREFVSEFTGAPAPGAGAHPDDVRSGWQSEYDDALPADTADFASSLACDTEATYTSEAGASDELPVNCVTWYEAMAFCIARGGRLPSEAEWEFAAAGGDENRLYPWGSDAVRESLAAVYPSELAPVGSLPEGAGRWQHADLAGNVWEWVLDWLDPTFYESVEGECTACLSVAAGTHRGLRGGAFSFDPSAARAAARSGELPGERKRSIGFRCAYDE